MKFALSLIAIIISFSVFASNVEVDVKGMTCGMCVESITQELKTTEKCDKISVSLEEKKARCSEIKGRNISDSEIKNAIKKAGYEAIKIRRY